MRRPVFVPFLVFAALGTGGAAPARTGGPSCQELQERRVALLEESKLATADVEAKNVELGEAAAALKGATDAARRQELQKRVDGLRRELNTLLDREHSTTDQLGALDAEIAKRCRKGGGR